MSKDTDTSTAAASTIDFSHPLYLHASDTQASTLVSQVLRGSDNYEVCSHSMRIALSAKNKLGIIDGTCTREAQPVALHGLWDCCNSVILSGLSIWWISTNALVVQWHENQY
ncbi:hypothetical protein QN277_001376 [Acacia crassicarpa]|uniref:Retrotransposon Copia-like N-terminal domain-containing protein n=1 Tax=Acacia crassicarpa TaxID=499986 RepID=A0AAE1N7A5_9FABA|nr:hypothetical protein QN277_001376 [Acacia crassicarpa]